MVENGMADSVWMLTDIIQNQHPDRDLEILRLFEREKLEVVEDHHCAWHFAVTNT
jgi:hypothetical protein